MRRIFAIFASLIFFAGFAHADESQDCLARQWKGTIGNAPIVMWFEFEGEDSSLAGLYYYQTSLADILLIKDDTKPDRWKEVDSRGKLTGHLTLSCKGDVLSGVWSSPDGARTLPVKAGVQESGSYSKERLDAFKPMIAERNSIGSFNYELLAIKDFKSVRGLQLIGNGKALSDINNTLLKSFKDNLDQALECLAYGRMRRGWDHGYEYEASMSMIEWNNSFVVIGVNHSEYCGGIHPLSGSGATTYNLKTGKTEDVSQWLIERHRKDISKESALGKIIIEIYLQENPDNECPDFIKLSGDGIWPTEKGIIFQTSAPYAQSACILDIAVPYKKLSPYFSPAGKENVKAFQSDKP
jgi:hypothetical protein